MTFEHIFIGLYKEASEELRRHRAAMLEIENRWKSEFLVEAVKEKDTTWVYNGDDVSSFDLIKIWINNYAYYVAYSSYEVKLMDHVVLQNGETVENAVTIKVPGSLDDIILFAKKKEDA